MTHPPGAIIFAGGEFLRYSGFMFSLLEMEKPAGTRVLMKQSTSVVDNLNYCIRNLPPECEWVHIQADDHIWKPDALTRLLDRQVDVIVPLMLKRAPPFNTVLFKNRTAEGYMPYAIEDLPREGLVKAYAAGSGGMTIRRHVLDVIGDPWFTYTDGEYLNEDLALCGKIRDAGFTIWCDVEVPMGHRASYTVWPVCDEKGWGIGLNLGQSPDGTPQVTTIRPTKEARNGSGTGIGDREQHSGRVRAERGVDGARRTVGEAAHR